MCNTNLIFIILPHVPSLKKLQKSAIHLNMGANLGSKGPSKGKKRKEAPDNICKVGLQSDQFILELEEGGFQEGHRQQNKKKME